MQMCSGRFCLGVLMFACCRKWAPDCGTHQLCSPNHERIPSGKTLASYRTLMQPNCNDKIWITCNSWSNKYPSLAFPPLSFISWSRIVIVFLLMWTRCLTLCDNLFCPTPFECCTAFPRLLFVNASGLYCISNSISSQTLIRALITNSLL